MILRPNLRLVLFAILALAFLAPSTMAQAATCEVQDFNDPAGDEGGTVPDQASGHNKGDLTTGCLSETEAGFAIVIGTTAAPTAGTGQTHSFMFHFTTNGTAYTVTYTSADATTSEPALEGVTVTETGPQLTLVAPRSSIGPTVSDIFIESETIFVTATAVSEGGDRAPDGTAVLFPAGSGTEYRVGSRAPPTLDSDGDGVTDRNEIAQGTSPTSLDTDFDGLLDGGTVEAETGSEKAANYTAAGILVLRDDGTLIQFAGEGEFGTNASHPDTDGDGLLDGANVTATSGSDAANTFQQFGAVPYQGDLFLGEYNFGADPASPDTDADGLDDYQEVTGADTNYGQQAFFPGHDGSTNPQLDDTDGDGLTDGEEHEGVATLGGSPVTFTPTNPNGGDTDSDGLTDFEELSGEQVDAGGVARPFPPTDPTVGDSDGDSFNDGLEVAAGSDPMDPNSVPQEGGDGGAGGAEASYLWLSSVAMLVVGLLCVVGILVRWG